MRPAFLTADWYAPLADTHRAKLVERDGVTLVSFRENRSRTEMRVGRYVRRFCDGTLKDEDVERIAAASDVLLRGVRVKLTQDPEEIETIYANGPRSCMTDLDYHTGGIRAARVYAGPDLAVAYLGDPSDVSARAVCWPGKKLHAPIYGDVSRMRRMLEQMGYERGPFIGARIRLLETEHGDLTLPMLDDLVGIDRLDRENSVCILGSIGGGR